MLVDVLGSFFVFIRIRLLQVTLILKIEQKDNIKTFHLIANDYDDLNTL